MTDDNHLDPVPEVDGVDYVAAMLTGHRLALSIQDAWASCFKAAVKRLVDTRSKVAAEALELAEGVFGPNFVKQSCTEIADVVANALPNDIATTYDFYMLQRSLRQILDDFANEAGRIVKERSKKRGRKRKKAFWNAVGRSIGLEDSSTPLPSVPWATKKERRRASKDLRNLAKETEGKVVEAALSPRQTS